ncbi:hypothetical protein, partial [Geitlerinema sp. P-1104]|uniref:hypothetical protein n=1 Tax=Geitlerinema sp. P-1104 TaxID=2546230 RepID=UPI00197FBEEA
DRYKLGLCEKLGTGQSVTCLVTDNDEGGGFAVATTANHQASGEGVLVVLHPNHIMKLCF